MNIANPDLSRFARIPTLLIDQSRWVVWRLEDRGENLTKIPYQTNGTRADSTDPATWTDYATAFTAYSDRPHHFSGIGFVLGDGFCGVDLDDCMVDGQLLPYARQIIDRLDTYCEITPSGTGVKLFMFGDPLPPTANRGGTGKRVFNPTANRPGKIEMYSEDRFFTVTGNTLEAE